MPVAIDMHDADGTTVLHLVKQSHHPGAEAQHMQIVMSGVTIIETHHELVRHIAITSHKHGPHTLGRCQINTVPGGGINANQHRVLVAIAIATGNQVAAIRGPAGWVVRSTAGASQQACGRTTFEIPHPEVEHPFVRSQEHDALAIRAEIDSRNLRVAEQHLTGNQRRLRCSDALRQGGRHRQQDPAEECDCPTGL